jgi:hypothetical protein
MTEREREIAIEAVASAHRERDLDGSLRTSPAFADLDAAGRVAAHDLATFSRRLEAALDPEGLSSSARTVLARIARA